MAWAHNKSTGSQFNGIREAACRHYLVLDLFQSNLISYFRYIFFKEFRLLFWWCWGGEELHELTIFNGNFYLIHNCGMQWHEYLVFRALWQLQNEGMKYLVAQILDIWETTRSQKVMSNI